LRRVDRAAGEDHFTPHTGTVDEAILRVFEPDGPAAFEQDPVRQGADFDPQIGAFHGRAQIGDRGAATALVAHRQLQRPDPVLRGPVEISVEPVSSFFGTGHEGIVEFVAGAQIGHVERPTGAMMLVGAALLVLGAAEVGEHVVVRPAGVAELAPQVKILALAADVDQPVDRPPERPAGPAVRGRPGRGSTGCGPCRPLRAAAPGSSGRRSGGSPARIRPSRRRQ